MPGSHLRLQKKEAHILVQAVRLTLVPSVRCAYRNDPVNWTTPPFDREIDPVNSVPAGAGTKPACVRTIPWAAVALPDAPIVHAAGNVAEYVTPA